MNPHCVQRFTFCPAYEEVIIIITYLMNLTLLITLLTLTYVIPHANTAPFTWQNLHEILTSGNLSQLVRTPKCDALYQEFRTFLKSQNTSLPQFVKKNIFGFQNNPRQPIYLIKTIILEGQSVKIYTTGEDSLIPEFIDAQMRIQQKRGIEEGNKFILLAQNDFSYDIAPGINHWVIWSSHQFNKQSTSAVLDQVLRKDIEYMFYSNPPAVKSIPEICHMQLFLRRRIPQSQQM